MGGDTTPKMHQENLSLMATGKHIYIYKWSSAVSGHGWGHDPENAQPCEKRSSQNLKRYGINHIVDFAYQCSHTGGPVQMNFENMSCSRPARMNIDKQISLYDENLNSILGTNFFHRVVHFRGRVPTHGRSPR